MRRSLRRTFFRPEVLLLSKNKKQTTREERATEKCCSCLFFVFFSLLFCFLSKSKLCWHLRCVTPPTGKNYRFPFLDILGYLKNTHKNPKFGRVRHVPTRELGWEFPGWDLSHFAKFGIFTLKYPIMGICYFFLCPMAPYMLWSSSHSENLGYLEIILVHIDCETVKDTSAWALLLKKKLII